MIAQRGCHSTHNENGGRLWKDRPRYREKSVRHLCSSVDPLKYFSSWLVAVLSLRASAGVLLLSLASTWHLAHIFPLYCHRTVVSQLLRTYFVHTYFVPFRFLRHFDPCKQRSPITHRMGTHIQAGSSIKPQIPSQSNVHAVLET